MSRRFVCFARAVISLAALVLSTGCAAYLDGFRSDKVMNDGTVRLPGWTFLNEPVVIYINPDPCRPRGRLGLDGSLELFFSDEYLGGIIASGVHSQLDWRNVCDVAMNDVKFPEEMDPNNEGNGKLRRFYFNVECASLLYKHFGAQ